MLFRLKLWRQGPCSPADMMQPSVSVERVCEGTSTGRWETTRRKQFRNDDEGCFPSSLRTNHVPQTSCNQCCTFEGSCSSTLQPSVPAVQLWLCRAGGAACPGLAAPGKEGVKASPAAGARAWHGSRGCEWQHKSILLVTLATAHCTAHWQRHLQEMMQLQLSGIVFTLLELILSWEGRGGVMGARLG